MAISLHAKLSFMKKNKNVVSADKRSKYSGQSIKAIPIRILTIGKKRSQGTQLLVTEYKEKIKYYCSIEDIHVRSNPKHTSWPIGGEIQYKNMKNSCLSIAQMTNRSVRLFQVVVLDELGKEIGSNQLADLVGDAGRTGSSTLAFCIGGPYGHGPLVRNRADLTIRLSSMVLNHQIALLVLLEQLYRAWTIIKGQKYNH